MNILIFGADSATHVLAWKLVNSPVVGEVIVAPGNGGTSFFASAAALSPAAAGTVTSFVLSESIDLVVADTTAAAAELPDELRALPLPVVGPGHALWPLHGDRCAAHEWLAEHGLPLPRGRVCGSRAEAEQFAATLSLPVRVAAAERSGLQLSCTTRGEVGPAIAECFAASPGRILVQEIVAGPRVAASLLADGETTLGVPALRLHVPPGAQSEDLEHVDGVHAAATPLWRKLETFLDAQVRQPLAEGLRAYGAAARTWIGVTCVVGPRGPLVEALRLVPDGVELAGVLPRLRSDLLPLLVGCARGTLGAVAAPEWNTEALAGVALRWPADSAMAGTLPHMLFDAFTPGTLVFHHGTTPLSTNAYQARSGRPGWFAPAASLTLTTAASPSLAALVVATGPDLATARARVYDNLRRLPPGQLAYTESVGEREL